MLKSIGFTASTAEGAAEKMDAFLQSGEASEIVSVTQSELGHLPAHGDEFASWISVILVYRAGAKKE